MKTLYFCVCLLWTSNTVLATPLTYELAIELAIEHDSQNKALQLQSHANQTGLDAVARWNNPQLTLGIMNASADGFDLHQQAMTQQQIKYSQQLPKAGAFAIKKRQANLTQAMSLWAHKEHQATLSKQVGQLWLAAHWHQRLSELLSGQKSTLQEIADQVTLLYESGDANTQQHDVVASKLAVQQIEQQILTAQMNQQEAILTLGAWLPQKTYTWDVPLPQLQLLPAIDLNKHPQLQLSRIKSEQAAQQTELKSLNKKPQWGIHAAYGVRLNDPMGGSRDDLVSVGVSFDMPWMNRKHHDAAISQSAQWADAAEQLWQQNQKTMQAQWMTWKNKAASEEQLYLNYKNHLLPQSEAIIESLMQAFANDEASLMDVLRAKLQRQKLATDAAKHHKQWISHLIELKYFQAGASQ